MNSPDKLSVHKPTSIWQRPVELKFGKLLPSLGKGAIAAVSLNWTAEAKDGVDKDAIALYHLQKLDRRPHFNSVLRGRKFIKEYTSLYRTLFGEIIRQFSCNRAIRGVYEIFLTISIAEIVCRKSLYNPQ